MLVLKPCVSRVRIDQLAFSPDGRALAAPGGTGGVMLWTAFANGAKAERVPTGIPGVGRLAFGPGDLLFAANDHLAVIDLATQKAHTLPIIPWHTLWFGASPDGARLVVSEEDRGRERCRVTCWAVGEYEKPVWAVTVRGQVWSDPLFLPGGRFIFCENRRHGTPHWFSNRVTYSLETGAELDVSGCLQDLPELVTLASDRSRMACRTRETIRVYPTAGGVLDFAYLKNDSKRHFTGVAFHPSGRYLAATSNDETVKLYDTTTWDVARTFTWDVGRMRSIAFSPDGTLAAAGSDSGKVVLWDVDV